MNPLCSRVVRAGLKLILGSQSPRRRQLLEAAGFEFEVVTPSQAAEENAPTTLSPAELVAELAYRKAADVAARVNSALVIGCDTVAECDGRILGKPADEDDARRMLETLSGRRHRVLSGLCLWAVRDGGSTASAAPLQRVEVTSLDMDRLADAQLNEYLACGQWRGKAGSFGYQDELDWVHVVEGSDSNVVGLPMALLEAMLLEMFPAGRC